jgi:hypothetical protein
MNLRDALARLQPIPVAAAAPEITTEAPHPDRCRCCGEPIVWSRPGAIAFADGGSAHVACYERAEAARIRAAARRAVESPDALADEAELTAHGEPLP